MGFGVRVVVVIVVVVFFSLLGFDARLSFLPSLPPSQEWRDDLRAVLRKAGESDTKVVFLFVDTQIKYEAFVEDINNLLNIGEVPNLFDGNDVSVITENVRPRAKKVRHKGSLKQFKK